jgi:GNAT superfamily N-acetyltransferase
MIDSVEPSRSDALLDNPIWNSLTTSHAHLAVGAGLGNDLARRFPVDIGPLSGLKEPTAAALADLGAIIPEGDVAVLFLDSLPETPDGWQLLKSGRLVQMICPKVPDPPSIQGEILPLAAADFPEMVALATLTEPGPFRPRTPTLGGFLGIRVDGQLAAMAGHRLSPTGFVEISAVCTHPDFRGRGYGFALVAAVTRSIHAEGRTPFLTSYEANLGAVRVYRQVGYSVRRTFELAVLKPPPVPTNASPNAAS